MGATGIFRPIDHFGRLALPVELRATLGLQLGDSLEVFVDGSSILLRKYEPGCIFCGEGEAGRLIMYRGRKVCAACAKELRAGARKRWKVKKAVDKGNA